MITSFIEGRIRFRSPELKKQAMASMLEEAANSLDGVLSLKVNTRLGSALLIYDPTVLSTDELRAQGAGFLELLDTEPAPKPANCSSKMKVLAKNTALINNMLGASWFLTGFSLLAPIKYHALIGTIFMGLTGFHWVQHSQRKGKWRKQNLC